MKNLYEKLKIKLKLNTVDLKYFTSFGITYFFVIVFLVAKIVVEKNTASSETNRNVFFYISLFIDAVVPSTIAYVIGCNVNNLIEQSKKNQPVIFNIMTILLAMVCTVLYTLYISFPESWFVIITSLLFIVFVLFWNQFSYYESIDELTGNKRTFSR